MARNILNNYLLCGAIALLLCLFPVESAVANSLPDGIISWVVRDTSISKQFIRSYLTTLRANTRKISKRTLKNVRINNILVVHFNTRTRAIAKIQLLDRSTKPFNLDLRVVERMPAQITGMLVNRMYAWDETETDNRTPYPDDIMELLESRNNRRIRAAFWRTPFPAMLSALHESQFAITSDYSIAASLGNVEYGYPLGAAGLGRLAAGTKNTKVYFTFPVQGVTTTELKGAGGLGFTVDFNTIGGGFQFQRSEPNFSEKSLRVGAYAYYSKIVDLSEVFVNGDLRWKVGPAFVDLKLGTDTTTTTLPYQRKTHESMFLFYTRLEAVAGQMGSLPLSQIEIAMQALIGTKKYFLVSATYNVNAWLGVELQISGILPEDQWHDNLYIIAGPRFRF